jgi:tetratricopeptide (TPR) repeat protein
MGGTVPGEEKMLTLEDVKSAVRDSNELWKAGRERDALELLNNRIRTAGQDNSAVQAKILSLHASAIAESAGDIDAARSYLKTVLIYEPENALALFKIAKILNNQGKSDEARDIAAHSYSIAAASNTEEGRGLLELLVNEWPDIGHRTS